MRTLPYLIALLLAAAATVSAQRASRPAEEWVKTLEGADRLAGLRVGDVVGALKLKPGEVIADLGAGSGPFVVPFAKAVGPKGKVYAVEIDRGFFPFIE